MHSETSSVLPLAVMSFSFTSGTIRSVCPEACQSWNVVCPNVNSLQPCKIIISVGNWHVEEQQVAFRSLGVFLLYGFHISHLRL